MTSGTIRPETISFDALDIDILAGHGHDPFMLTALAKLADPHAPGAMDEICRVYNQRVIGEPRRGALA